MILMIDNYDSFTYNLVQYFQKLEQHVVVKRHDEITVHDIAKLNPDHIVISPGPKSPSEAGVSLDIVDKCRYDYPILGICLGHQTIAQALGANVVRAKEVMHGKTSVIRHNNTGVFMGLDNPLTVCRYHSLVVEPDSLPADLEVTAWVDIEHQPEIMGLKHKTLPLEGVQFHPEAILTESGLELLANFIKAYS